MPSNVWRRWLIYTASVMPTVRFFLLTSLQLQLTLVCHVDNVFSMDPDDPNSRILSINLKHFLEYSAQITNSEDAIYNLRTSDAQASMSHLQVVDVPHENVNLRECWNFLDIPLSTSEMDPKMRCVSPRLCFSSYLTSLSHLAHSTTSPSTTTDGAPIPTNGRPIRALSTGPRIG